MLASHALSIFGDHSDVYACRQTGAAMLCAATPGSNGFGAVAHLSAIRPCTFHTFLDGFRTSHEIQKIEVWDYEELKELVDMDAVDAFRRRALNPERRFPEAPPRTRRILPGKGSMQQSINELPAIVEEYITRSMQDRYRLQAVQTTMAPRC